MCGFLDICFELQIIVITIIISSPYLPRTLLVQPIWLLIPYYIAVAIVVGALFCVSCRDPGLMERVVDEEAGEGGWFWNEQVGSF